MILFFLLIIFLSPTGLKEPASHRLLIIWNIGQGAFATVVLPTQCRHFDVGGEKFPKELPALCENKINSVYLSHDDWDHMSFFRRLSHWKNICLVKPPRIFSSVRKRMIIEAMPPCKEALGPKELTWTPKGKTTNDESRVYVDDVSKGLFPGDSTSKEEVTWAKQITGKEIKWWILGHHGSASSSGEILIKKLGHPSAAISSARWKKYHHPHPAVVARLWNAKIPLLKTEDWGNIKIELD